MATLETMNDANIRTRAPASTPASTSAPWRLPPYAPRLQPHAAGPATPCAQARTSACSGPCAPTTWARRTSTTTTPYPPTSVCGMGCAAARSHRRPARLPGLPGLPACPPARPAGLPACPPARLPACPPAGLPACRPAGLPARRPAGATAHCSGLLGDGAISRHLPPSPAISRHLPPSPVSWRRLRIRGESGVPRGGREAAALPRGPATFGLCW